MDTKQPVDLAEVASEVVRVMHRDGLIPSAATRVVMAARNMEYGNGAEIARIAEHLANEALDKIPDIDNNVNHHRWQKAARGVFYSNAAASHEALAELEATK